ncbi:MAG TPA: sigma 54-interacting transcriptional regulator, partial [Verrucomicrobiae bacterium]|nr:sigma 54-interacting transcriptional regulator [Verrucomicrobiae bacterium]
EVGDFPPELQPKLLRALQEKEFERLGGNQTYQVNVRVVAATSRDLLQMVAERQFRSDLYYRLSVFPIRIPALRERPEDIPLLAYYFVNHFARQMNKRIDTIPQGIMDSLKRHHWPGNVRELENFLERSVIMSNTRSLTSLTNELERSVCSTKPEASRPATLEECERDHILRALHETRWLVGGTHGAAARLGLRRTTLIWKMQKLGIARKPKPFPGPIPPTAAQLAT